ncbi:MAG: hypothetical protein HYY20_10640 [Candidatus Tectomicrobia bacterium]|uniref:Uncharacterized protein n=1 Tax=Tectimicrobiota bacterium TaxID=2528274 RepID=A0A932CPW1_UNCTE|nr:hypothetical protein [Candidatus Tectomicrobia bacterium]
MKRFIIVAGILVAISLLWYISLYISKRNCDQLDHNLKLARLLGQLGMASYEVNRNNYSNATQWSTVFFNGVRDAANNTEDESVKQQLESVLARRDEITIDLAKSNPAVKEKLAQMYVNFYQIAMGRKIAERASIVSSGFRIGRKTLLHQENAA